MPDTFWLSLAAKMVSTGLIVVIASLLVERAGPFIGAMVATLPISAGPAYIILSLDHDSAFIARSALVSLAINAAVALFIAVYALLAQRRGLLLSFGAAILVWFTCAMIVFRLPWSVPAALACLHLTVVPLGIPLGIALWFAISVLWNLTLIAIRNRRRLRP